MITSLAWRHVTLIDCNKPITYESHRLTQKRKYHISSNPTKKTRLQKPNICEQHACKYDYALLTKKHLFLFFFWSMQFLNGIKGKNIFYNVLIHLFLGLSR